MWLIFTFDMLFYSWHLCGQLSDLSTILLLYRRTHSDKKVGKSIHIVSLQISQYFYKSLLTLIETGPLMINQLQAGLLQ